MPLKFLLDEHLRGPLCQAIQHHNGRGTDIIDATRVGDDKKLPFGSTDKAILLWAEQADRILVSQDKSSLSRHLEEHLNAGHHCVGIFIVRQRATLPTIVSILALVAYESESWEWRDRIEYIP
jgi:hypothetical protein